MNRICIILASVMMLASCQNNNDKTEKTTAETPVDANVRHDADSLSNYISGHPNDANALMARAKIYIDQKNMKYAIADAQAALAIDTLNPEAYLLWGDVNYYINKTRESKEAWETCIALDKDNIECRLKLAELYNVVQEYAKSMALVDEVMKYDKANATAYFIRGINYRDMKGDTAKALQNIQKAIDLDNNYILALDLAGVMLSAKNNPLAVSYFNRILEINPNHHATYYNLGMYYMNTEDWNPAIESFTKAVQLMPTDIESYFNLGYIHLQLGANDVAKDYFSQALKIQPVNHRALYGRGYAYERMGDVQNAEKDYREALSYNPSHEASKIALKRLLNGGK